MSSRGVARHLAASPRADEVVRSIASPATTFVSPPSIRRAVAGYGAEQGWAPNLTATAVREGTAVALSVAGLAVQTPSAGSVEPWMRTVPTSFDALQALTGLDRAGVRSALEVLVSAGVLRTAHDGAGLTVAYSDGACWAPHRLLADAPWSLVSLALTRANAPLRAGLVVFAELVLDTEGALRPDVLVGGDAESLHDGVPKVWLELTLKELAHRVGYHLSHIENALAGLEAAACLTRLRGTSGRALRLAPWTIGVESPPSELLAPLNPPAPGQDPTSGASEAHASGQIMIEFQGVRAIMAPGDTLDVSGRDTDGSRILRIRTADGDVVIRPPRVDRRGI